MKRRAPALEARRTTRRPPAGVDEDDGEGVDRISALPDALLGEIISLLYTKAGARTQILSSRWRHLWRSAPLHLDCRELPRTRERTALVSSILSSHHGPGRRFYVQPTWETGNQTDLPIGTWLRSPALDNLQELEFCGGLHMPPPPTTAFDILRVLNIGASVFADATVQGLQLPQLKQLGLQLVQITDCSLRSFIDGCPTLEFLLMQQCRGFRCARINSLTLRAIGVDNYQNPAYKYVQLQELIIDNAPCLERLLLNFKSCVSVSVAAAPKLETIGYLSDDNYMSRQGQLNRLMLGSTVIQGLHVDKLAMVVCSVKVLGVRMKSLSLDMVIGLMTCFPCLEKLHIWASKSVSTNSWRRKHQNLIKCFDIPLKTVVLESYRGTESQVNFVTFFVLNARKLESMTLQVESKHYHEEFDAEQRRKLHLENRASGGALFRFTTERCVSIAWYMKHVCGLQIDPFTWQW